MSDMKKTTIPPCTPPQELYLYGRVNDDPYWFSQQDVDCKWYPQPLVGFKKHKDSATGRELPNCCQSHRALADQAAEWFSVFPNCCDHHKSLAEEGKLKKQQYEFIPEKIVQLVAQTENLIKETIDKPDWEKAVTGYIDYCFVSFGLYAVGLNVYLDFIKKYVASSEDILPEKTKIITDHIIYVRANFKYDVLSAEFFDYDDHIVQDWLHLFPFDLEMFKSHRLLSQYFTIPLPYDSNKKRFQFSSIPYSLCEHNLVEYLKAQTVELISRINSSNLFQKGVLTDPEKMKLDLLLRERTLQIEKMKRGDDPHHNESVDYLEQWFKEEITFLDQIAPLINEREDLLPEKKPMPELLKKHYEAMSAQGYDIQKRWLIDDPSNIHEETSPQLSPTRQIIEDIFDQMGSKGTYGWEYAFRNRTDYSLYVSLLESHFQHPNYELPSQVIPLRPGSKSQMAIALGSIHKELGEKLKGDNAFFDIVRVLSHFHKVDDENLYKDLSRRRD